MTTLEQINYIKIKYKELELDSSYWFNPNIDTETGYIPLCTQCLSDYEKFKTMDIYNDMKIEFKHPSSCLWYDWFINKIKLICPTVKIVKKINR